MIDFRRKGERLAGRVFALVLLLSLGASAQAGATLRCGKMFVRPGDSKFEVLRNCGDPVFRDRVSGDDGDQIEQWVYESHWSRFPRMITFVGGRVARIERLDD